MGFYKQSICLIWIRRDIVEFPDKSPLAFGANFQVAGVKHQQCVGFLLPKRFATENATLKRRRKEERKKEASWYHCNTSTSVFIWSFLDSFPHLETGHPLHHFPVVPPLRWLLVRCAQTTFCLGGASEFPQEGTWIPEIRCFSSPEISTLQV